MDERIAFVGGGNMALALATRLAPNWRGAIAVADPVAAQRARFPAAVATTANNEEAVRDADVVVLAVKPQVFKSATREAAPALADHALVMSVAAGVPLAAVERWTRPDGRAAANRAVVRCMPNTPALVGAGITGLVANAHVTAAGREIAQAIMAVAGEVLWFDTDAELDAVTALSGSGPAYFFRAMEALVDAGQDIGLAPDVAKRLAVAAGAGAAAMARSDDPSVLRERVTSPGGTTERALSILAEMRFAEALRAAAVGAFERSRELSRELGEP